MFTNNGEHIKKALASRAEEIVCAITDTENKTYFVTNAIVLDFIKHQEEDKKALIAGQETLQRYIEEKEAEIQLLKQEYRLLQKMHENACDKAEKAIAQRKKAYEIIPKLISSSKLDGQKEFSEKLKERQKPVSFDEAFIAVDVEDIDFLLKEYEEKHYRKIADVK